MTFNRMPVVALAMLGFVGWRLAGYDGMCWFFVGLISRIAFEEWKAGRMRYE